MKKIICIVATVVAISGCTAHGGGLDNRTKGAILGGVASLGGSWKSVWSLVGISGNAAATALGAVTCGFILASPCPRIIPKSIKKFLTKPTLFATMTIVSMKRL